MSVLALCFWNLSFQMNWKEKLSFICFGHFVNIYFVSRYFSVAIYFVVFCLQTVLQDERQSQALMLKVSNFHLYFLWKRSVGSKPTLFLWKILK